MSPTKVQSLPDEPKLPSPTSGQVSINYKTGGQRATSWGQPYKAQYFFIWLAKLFLFCTPYKAVTVMKCLKSPHL